MPEVEVLDAPEPASDDARLESDVERLLVNLQLIAGVDLADPDGLIEGTGKRITHVKIRTVEAASSEPVVAIKWAQLAVRPPTGSDA